jgi:hypothetical protein
LVRKESWKNKEMVDNLSWANLILVQFIVPLAWPVALLVGIFILRSPIHNLLERVVELGPGGAKLSPPQLQTATDSAQRTSEIPIDTSKSDPELDLWEKPIRREIEKRGLVTSDGLTEQLISALAQANRRADFENVARVIFGTQIGALKQLNSLGPLPESTLKKWFKEHKKRAKENAFGDFKQWMRYLLDLPLVTMRNGEFEISRYGRQVLDFLFNSNITEDRGY